MVLVVFVLSQVWVFGWKWDRHGMGMQHFTAYIFLLSSAN